MQGHFDMELMLSAPGATITEVAWNPEGSPRGFVGAHVGPVGALAAQAARVAVGHLQVLPPQGRLGRPAVPALLPRSGVTLVTNAPHNLTGITHASVQLRLHAIYHNVLRWYHALRRHNAPSMFSPGMLVSPVVSGSG